MHCIEPKSQNKKYTSIFLPHLSQQTHDFPFSEIFWRRLLPVPFSAAGAAVASSFFSTAAAAAAAAAAATSSQRTTKLHGEKILGGRLPFLFALLRRLPPKNFEIEKKNI